MNMNEIFKKNYISLKRNKTLEEDYKFPSYLVFLEIRLIIR